MRYDFMAGARIVPKNRPLDRKEKREEEPLCTDVRESGDRLKRSGGGGMVGAALTWDGYREATPA